MSKQKTLFSIEKSIQKQNLKKKNHTIQVLPNGKLLNAPKETQFDLVKEILLENNDISR